MATIVSFINFKGGVGKTTICVEIAASLAHKFKERVLVVDLDPQTNATLSLMDEKDWEKHSDSNGTLRELFQSFYEGTDFDISKILVKTPVKYQSKLDSLDLIPSHIELFGMDLRLATKFGHENIQAKLFLRQALAKIQNNYTYILIDCPPNLYLATQNGLFTSERYVIVALAEYLSTLGIAHIQRSVNNLFADASRILESLGTGGGSLKVPDLVGIIFNRIRYQSGGTSSEEFFLKEFRTMYPELVFKTTVPQSTKIAERPQQKVPIAVSGYAADHDYESRMERLAEEFYDRITKPAP
ncbi:MAG: AAA family ATPase [Deltaproteobacteria bacterium]|nr:AAA family ATPase [Deltaproteobacteria bacterium]